MTISPPTSCMTPLCGNPAVQGTWRCAECTKPSPIAKPNSLSVKRRNQPFYNQQDWRRFTATMKVFNPQCQEIEHGIQCPNPSKVSHHLQDPSDRPDLKYSPSNIVCLCQYHQNRGLRGDDGKGIYAPTKWKVPGTHELITYEHKQPTAGQPAHMSWIGG